jgi:hypothetical protein
MVAGRGAVARFDVFLSHNRRDAPVVERIASRLRAAGVEVWLDAWHVTPGDRWQDRAAEGMAASDACAVFLGPHDVGDWEKEELGVALGRAAKEPGFRVFLVLLPGVPDPFEPSRLSPFLNTRAWVDLRGGWNDDASFQPLISAIKGTPMGRAPPAVHSGKAPSSSTAHWLSRRSAIWLGTLSLVLAIAAGMFTLRDQFFPNESGNAQASIPEYQHAVGDICGALNRGERARSRDSRGLPKRLQRARTTLAQRNAVLDSVRRTLASADHELALFESLVVPPTLTARHRAAAAAWNRNVGRIQDYAQRLDAAGTRAGVFAAVDVLARMRPALASDVVALDAGLVNLGGGRCRLDPPVVEPSFTLPRTAHHAAPHPHRVNALSATQPTKAGPTVPSTKTPTPVPTPTPAPTPTPVPSRPRSRVTQDKHRFNVPSTYSSPSVPG